MKSEVLGGPRNASPLVIVGRPHAFTESGHAPVTNVDRAPP
jgi:hypothetical protein